MARAGASRRNAPPQPAQGQQPRQAQVLQVEEQVALRPDGPAQVSLEEAPLPRLLEGPHTQLGQRQRQGHRQQHAPGEQRLPGLAAAESLPHQKAQPEQEQPQHRPGGGQEQGAVLPVPEELFAQSQRPQAYHQQQLARPGGRNLPGEAPQQPGRQPHPAHQAQGQEGVGVDHGQGAGHKAHQEKAPPLPLVDRPAQQVQRREQHRPAKQRSPLGEHHIHQHVDPADVLPHQVGGRLVKGGEDAGEVFHTAAQKVEKPKAPVEGEEHPGQGRLGPALCHGGQKRRTAQRAPGPPPPTWAAGRQTTTARPAGTGWRRCCPTKRGRRAGCRAARSSPGGSPPGLPGWSKSSGACSCPRRWPGWSTPRRPPSGRSATPKSRKTPRRPAPPTGISAGPRRRGPLLPQRPAGKGGGSPPAPRRPAPALPPAPATGPGG